MNVLINERMKYVNYKFKPWKTAVIRHRINGPTTTYRKNNLKLGNTVLKHSFKV